jgi:cytochrome c oxidase cbb3-type subunit III
MPPVRYAVSMISILMCCLTACSREDDRSSRPVPAASGRAPLVRDSDLQAGPVTPQVQVRNPYEGDPQMIAEGKRLYSWFNCVGCHFHGGGGIGPALIDGDWIYGPHPANIYESIVKGRPNGMPAFQGKLPDNDVWKIVAYVQALSQGVQGARSGSSSTARDQSVNRAVRNNNEEGTGQ